MKLLKSQVFKDGLPVADAKYATGMECAAYILSHGWIDTVERYGVIWAKGVEIRRVKE